MEISQKLHDIRDAEAQAIEAARIDAIHAADDLGELTDATDESNALQTWPENVWFPAGDFDVIQDFHEYFNDEQMPNGYTSNPSHCVAVQYIRADIVTKQLADMLAEINEINKIG